MKKAIVKVFVLFGIFGMVLSTTVHALESEAKSQVRGIVVDISPAAIVVQEVRDEGNEISQFELAINDKTRFSADDSADIALGDAVEIEFTETDEGKVAILIEEISAKASGDKAAKKMLKADLEISDR